MEDLGCPVVRTPLSNLADGIQRKGQADTVGASLAAGVAGRFCSTGTSRLRDSTPDFLSGFTPLAFVIPMTSARQRRFELRVFLPLGELPSQVASPIYPTL